ncbi:MAG: L-2-amino-thiazoline-4-carboxylic acid hydrolase [Solobacterium sp.]|nr:L-2-amino-thiazoline-4-carboxylic acid hydrolase [Solobacterium sp.]
MTQDLFNEQVHAYIAAKYYQELTTRYAKRGQGIFIHATQYYASTRGRRMAQRALRDGKELTYAVYQEYGEWAPTQYAVDKGVSNQSEITEWSPDLTMKITRCPWHAQFKAMGMTDAGSVYCAHLDNSICRGFNPYLVYEVPQTLNTHDYCIQIVRNAGFTEGENHPKHPEYIMPFKFHCAHIYWAFKEVCDAVFGTEASDAVLEAIRHDYGDEAAEILLSYRNHDFNVI